MYSIFVKLCEEHNIKPFQVAKALGISHPIISYWKTGKRTPSYKTLSLIADYFDVSIGYLQGVDTTKRKINCAELDADILSDKKFMKLVYSLYMLDDNSIDTLINNIDKLVDKSHKPRTLQKDLINYLSLSKEQLSIINNTITAFAEQNK